MDLQQNSTPSLGLPAPTTEPPASTQSLPRQDQSSTPVVNAAASATTDDSKPDDLDQEWVLKAKAIIEKTKNDPFVESKEMSKIKADYLRIRYNKQVKVAEDNAQ